MNSWAVCLAMIGVDSASQKGTETPHCVISVHLDLLQEINFQKKNSRKIDLPRRVGKMIYQKIGVWWSFFGEAYKRGVFQHEGPKIQIWFPFWNYRCQRCSGYLGSWPIFSPTSKPFGWWAKVFWRPSAKSQFLGEVWNVGQLEAFEAFCMTQIQLGEGNSCKARRQKLFTPED